MTKITDKQEFDDIRDFQFQGMPDLTLTSEAEMEEIAEIALTRNRNKINQAR